MIYTNRRIHLILLMAIKLVLCAAVGAGAGDIYSNTSRIYRRQDEEPFSWKREYWEKMQQEMNTERPEGGRVACCPSVKEMVAPRGGKNIDGYYVELYQDSTNIQQFYELSCREGVEGKPCRFTDARVHNRSVCVQKYSYSYALVRTPLATEVPERRRRELLPNEMQREKSVFSVPGSLGWSLDYIMVRSGCECELTVPKHKKRHQEKRNQDKQKRHPEKKRRLKKEGT